MAKTWSPWEQFPSDYSLKLAEELNKHHEGAGSSSSASAPLDEPNFQNSVFQDSQDPYAFSPLSLTQVDETIMEALAPQAQPLASETQPVVHQTPEPDSPITNLKKHWKTYNLKEHGKACNLTLTHQTTWSESRAHQPGSRIFVFCHCKKVFTNPLSSSERCLLYKGGLPLIVIHRTLKRNQISSFSSNMPSF